MISGRGGGTAGNSPQSMVQDDCAEVVEHGLVSAIEDLQGETILVTGGTGFMGTWIAEMCSYLNDQLSFNIKLILLSENARSFAERVPHLASRPDIILLEQEISTVVELPADVGFLIHAAATPDNRVHSSQPLKTIRAIVNGTDAVMSAAAFLPNLKQILHISSGLVYGAQQPGVTRISEKSHGIASEPGAITSVYSESKRMAETVCTAHRNQHRLQIVTARPFAFIGPYQRLDRPWAINNFIRDGLMGGPIRILGDTRTVRSYMYPSDMAWWILQILVHGTSGLSYNVGSPHPISLAELAEQIAANFSVTPRIVAASARGQDASERIVSRFVPDVTLSRSSLGLELCVDLDTAIKRTIRWNQSFVA